MSVCTLLLQDHYFFSSAKPRMDLNRNFLLQAIVCTCTTHVHTEENDLPGLSVRQSVHPSLRLSARLSLYYDNQYSYCAMCS